MDLDRYTEFSKLDSQGVLQNIEEFANQVETAQSTLREFAIPAPYIQAHDCVLLGSGSSYTANLIASRLYTQIGIPIVAWDQIGLPYSLTSKSLVIASSYSGETIETVSNFERAAKSGAKLCAITGGGSLGALCRKYNAPVFPIHYGAHSRHAIGFILTALYAIGSKLGYIEDTSALDDSITLLKGCIHKTKHDVVLSKNIAKQIALRLKNKSIHILAGGVWYGLAVRFAQQYNENSKSFAIASALNEFVLTGLDGVHFPNKMRDNIIYIILQSKYDKSHDRHIQSVLIQHFERKGIAYESLFIQPSTNMLAEVLQAIVLCDFISYYVALLNDSDPSAQPMKDDYNEMYISTKI
ncbi:SIS domain-containing protein [Candidatus Berkelbacteria bacterium]|uniref:SIS domain-containing protein n=1 Tax=Candidatus Berkelbacteria bacterium CG10_big_fil_rev_8_21_14_0_10_43_14 TaxID=1974515 RepID=A0A2M6R8A2_9BACT|nr:SIS domain-containing protein [Candidatus Berkelbacteria bacterium]OIP06904.1 MAG: hypothetical protein AUK41_01255 [Candidatus Berkelbacteria bacterium CG2_30_43_20]PIS06765.1 MAG: hypothetical protein COT79_02885 [Candidatus Berkelbacteria bacterium CG10_big_fil_rev_8_21_14_0_10_43_14]PIU87084.1 MAG: hypothetical protein COS66_02770 [Candidatus Berkelbacteria bacterium CG06_land_8_20_14_3_00_43_10]